MKVLSRLFDALQMVLTQWQQWELQMNGLSAFYKDHLHLEDENAFQNDEKEEF